MFISWRNLCSENVFLISKHCKLYFFYPESFNLYCMVLRIYVKIIEMKQWLIIIHLFMMTRTTYLLIVVIISCWCVCVEMMRVIHQTRHDTVLPLLQPQTTLQTDTSDHSNHHPSSSRQSMQS